MWLMAFGTVEPIDLELSRHIRLDLLSNIGSVKTPVLHSGASEPEKLEFLHADN